MKYLVCRITECGEEEYCEPQYITDDWTIKYPNGYRFRVYEILKNNRIGKIVKDEDTFMDEGMCFGYLPFDDDNIDNFVFIKKYPNFDRDTPMPKEVLEKFREIGGELENELYNCGEAYMENEEDNKVWVYGEYHDNKKCYWF